VHSAVQVLLRLKRPIASVNAPHFLTIVRKRTVLFHYVTKHSFTHGHSLDFISIFAIFGSNPSKCPPSQAIVQQRISTRSQLYSDVRLARKHAQYVQ
jgi:hypothetical protein